MEQATLGTTRLLFHTHSGSYYLREGCATSDSVKKSGPMNRPALYLSLIAQLVAQLVASSYGLRTGPKPPLASLLWRIWHWVSMVTPTVVGMIMPPISPPISVGSLPVQAPLTLMGLPPRLTGGLDPSFCW